MSSFLEILPHHPRWWTTIVILLQNKAASFSQFSVSSKWMISGLKSLQKIPSFFSGRVELSLLLDEFSY